MTGAAATRRLSVVIPCYRSEATIREVVKRLFATVASRPGFDCEVVLVNDASPDGTLDVLRALAAEDTRVKVLDLARNFGQHSALMAGYHHVSGEIVVSLDDDGQNPPEGLFTLVDALDQGHDVVLGKPVRSAHGLSRRIGTRINDWMARVLVGKPKDLEFTSFFAMRRFVLDEAIRYRNPFPYLGGILVRSTRSIVNVPVGHEQRLSGESTYTLRKLVSLWLNGFTAFSVAPLRAATLLGAVCSLLGFGLAAYVVFDRLTSTNILPGWTSLMAFQAILGGTILIMLGLVGEYVGRIYISINRTPQFVVRETWNLEE